MSAHGMASASRASDVEAVERDAHVTADALVADRRYLDAVAFLAGVNRGLRIASIDVRLVQLRHLAFDEAAHLSAGRPEWPPSYPDLFAGTTGVPEVDAIDLSADAIGAGILHHGCLIVRGLVSADRTAPLISAVDSAFEGLDAAVASELTVDGSPWFVPFEPSEGYSFGTLERTFIRQVGGVLAVESPRAMAGVIDTLRATDLGLHLSEYLGEWPALSVKKFTLRRTAPDSPTEWHQDGSFLGTTIHTVNTWLALTDCGVDAPGLELVARRFEEIVPTGQGSALFNWSVAHADVAREISPDLIVQPEFGAGDAVLFDQMTLHRTGLKPGMDATRYAIESWFFAPSSYPTEQIPIVF